MHENDSNVSTTMLKKDLELRHNGTKQYVRKCATRLYGVLFVIYWNEKFELCRRPPIDPRRHPLAICRSLCDASAVPYFCSCTHTHTHVSNSSIHFVVCFSNASWKESLSFRAYVSDSHRIHYLFCSKMTSGQIVWWCTLFVSFNCRHFRSRQLRLSALFAALLLYSQPVPLNGWSYSNRSYYF